MSDVVLPNFEVFEAVPPDRLDQVVESEERLLLRRPAVRIEGNGVEEDLRSGHGRFGR